MLRDFKVIYDENDGNMDRYTLNKGVKCVTMK